MAICTKTFTLNNGTKDAEILREAIKEAVKIEYRHFDTASAYQVESEVGQALKESGVPREQLYIVTKLWNTDHGDPEKALNESLKRLGTDYVDLYLIHWPAYTDENHKLLNNGQTNVDTWKKMEKLLETGKAKSIGVSNFSPKTLQPILDNAKIIPAVNQVEIHPYYPNLALQEYCDKHGIILTAYSPLGQSNKDLLNEPALTQLAQKYNITVGQAIISWLVKRGISVIPKSTRHERLLQNITTVDLTSEEVQSINDIHKQDGKFRRLCNNGKEILFGMSYKELGWEV